MKTIDSVNEYLTSLKNYNKKYRGNEGKAINNWKIGKKDKERYKKDPDIKHIRIEFEATNWDCSNKNIGNFV